MAVSVSALLSKYSPLLYKYVLKTKHDYFRQGFYFLFCPCRREGVSLIVCESMSVCVNRGHTSTPSHLYEKEWYTLMWHCLVKLWGSYYSLSPILERRKYGR